MLQTPHRPTRSRTDARRRRARRGVYTLWTILFLPALILLLAIAVDISHLWVARVELENAMEAAALSAVKEWGDLGTADTTLPRQVGYEYALANTINGTPVVIDLNDSGTATATNPNQNAACTGPTANLILGAVSQEPGVPCPRYIFDTRIRPSCGAGSVLIDATGQGNLDTGKQNEWGIAFHRDADTPTNLLITQIVINLGNNDAYFNSTKYGLSSDTATNRMVRCPGGSPSQNDIWGFDSPANQIQATFSVPNPSCPERYKVLTFDFYPYGTDTGFSPCDRFRFGVSVHAGCTNAQYDGDELGALGVTITIYFNNGPPVSTTLIPNQVSSNDCYCDVNPWDPYCPNSLTVNPTRIPDLPCPPSSSANNSGQSYALTSASGANAFGVRAQATLAVPSLICRLCGLTFGPFEVTACATAMYDCTLRMPRLIRVAPADFHCVLP